MADRAYLLDEFGNRKMVYAEALGAADKEKQYLCAGVSQSGHNKGQPCTAEMTLALPSDHRNYFTATRSSKHIKCCEFCETAKEKRLVHLDRVCREKTDAEILNSFLGGALIQRKSKARNLFDISEEQNESEEEEDVITDIRRARRNPLGVHELYSLLSGYSPEQLFARKAVKDWIIDARTFSHYVEHGLKDPQIAVAILKRTNPASLPESLLNAKKQYYVFRCWFQRQQGSLFFLIPKESRVLGQIFASETKEFAVLANWNRFFRAPNSYFCEPIQSDKQYTLNLDLD